jgi:uncharacterized Zn-finger protein
MNPHHYNQDMHGEKMTKSSLMIKPDNHLAPPHPTPDTPEMHTPFPVSGLRVSCDGGGGALGHPQVWLTLDETTRQVRCPYCSRLYVEENNYNMGDNMDAGSQV